ncbi:WapI family immunity protein [Paenibacillus sedimenti]|uniref:Uncharacterized protein n=1 Tax=Paenibacillus sedimenti TaxID=2770274 RepID=A0A926KN56_9BACL|nr:hypothetical protein [Paenibacillus sedimenti]MBD0380178.1 hypothetical protein [Paenibacillus sedimenti]
MPTIWNKEKNVFLSIDLLNNAKVDIQVDRPDFMNWVPFKFTLDLYNETYYLPINEYSPTFNVWEIEKIINGLEEIIYAMNTNTLDNPNEDRFKPFEHFCSEVYFEIKVFETLETDLINIEIWLTMAEFTNGDISDYNKGFRFIVHLKVLEEFLNGLKKQYKLIRNEHI